MPRLLYLGHPDALFRSRRMLLSRAGYRLDHIEEVQQAVASKAWRASTLTILSLDIPLEERDRLREVIARDGHAAIDLESALRLHGRRTSAEVGPETFLEVIGKAVMRAHAHAEIKGKNVAYVDAERRYIHVTDGFLELIGFHRDEVIGNKIDDFTYPGTAETASQFRRYLKDGRQSGRYFLRHKSGRKITVDFEAGVLADGCMYSKMEELDEEAA